MASKVSFAAGESSGSACLAGMRTGKLLECFGHFRQKKYGNVKDADASGNCKRQGMHGQ